MTVCTVSIKFKHCLLFEKNLHKPLFCFFTMDFDKTSLLIQNSSLSSPPTVIMCPSLSSFSLDHGKWKIVNGSHYEYGTRIIFTCNPGYYRVGPAHIQCLANGVWSWRNERPRCKSEWLLIATKKRETEHLCSFSSFLSWHDLNIIVSLQRVLGCIW